MDLLQLEHFLAVVEEGTFTRAAERVSRTQPAVSQSIKKLEEEVGGSRAVVVFIGPQGRAERRRSSPQVPRTVRARLEGAADAPVTNGGASRACAS